ncbi:MAG: hypothetical protein AMXMBFR64_38060 [Myxococcales bacterium]
MRWYDTDSMDNRDPARIERIAALVEPLLWRWFRPVIHGLDRIPAGTALYVGNHNAGMLTPDSYVFGIAALRAHGVSALPYGLMHEVPIRWPLVHQLFVPMGAVRACPDNGLRALREGHKVLVYPGGDLDAMRSWRDRHKVIFGPRRGYIRLALRAGAPIVPVVTAGAHETYVILDDGRHIAEAIGADRLFRVKRWPVALSLPWGLTIGPTPPHFPWPSRMVMEVLPPVHFDRHGEGAAEDADYVERCHEQVHGAMQAALVRLAAEREALNAAERRAKRGR